MALVTVQRTPSPRRGALPEEEDVTDEDGKRKSRRSQRSLKKLVNTVNTIKFVNRLRFSESYFTIKGAALILPKSDKVAHLRKRTRSKSTLPVSDIQTHLQTMFHELRQDDTIQVAIKLETGMGLSRYLAIVTTEVNDNRREGVIIGFHVTAQSAHIGLVLPVLQNTEVSLDGDGGFRIRTSERPHIFKPVSIQAMWSALMALDKMLSSSRSNPPSSSHQWVSHYTQKVTTEQTMINEWDIMDDLMVSRADSPGINQGADNENSTEKRIRQHLREIMVGADLEELTAYDLRIQLEAILKMPLKPYRSFIDQEMLLIVRQLDAPSLIFDFLYLGSEWNASNLQELKANGIGYILNVTREIDNFFPGTVKYMNIRLYDNEEADLLPHWEKTHRFICKARDDNSKILVHCKMGVSRSASSVIAFAMKEYGWSLDQTIDLVRERRPVIRPNDAFMRQLQTYEGILNASKQRWNPVFKSGSLSDPAAKSDLFDPGESSTDMADGGPSEEAHGDQSINISISSKQSTTLDKESENIVTYDLLTHCESDSESDQSDSDVSGSRPCSTTSTASYQLEHEDTDIADDGDLVFKEETGVRGLSYNKLEDAVTDRVCARLTTEAPQIVKTSPTPPEKSVEVVQRRETSNQNTPIEKRRKQTKSLPELSQDMESEEIQTTTPVRKSMSPTRQAGTDDISVCEGVVQKTREQIAASLISDCEAGSSNEELVPVTPGTVRKVLGQIESRDNLLPRSSSFKMARRKCTVDSDILQRSASVRVKRAKPIFPTSNLATHNIGGNCKSTGAEPTTEFFSTFSKIRQIPEDKVKFSIGEQDSTTPLSASEGSDSEELPSMPDFEAKSPSCDCDAMSAEPTPSTHPTNSTTERRDGSLTNTSTVCGKQDCMLKVASKPAVFSNLEQDTETTEQTSPVTVKSLVGAFEDIGSATKLNRPLTIHVDSFSSDPFAHEGISAADKSPLQRSQSLQVMENNPHHTASASISEEKTFDIKAYAPAATSSAQKPLLLPYWKIKRDNSKLAHSFSSAAVSSKDVT